MGEEFNLKEGILATLISEDEWMTASEIATALFEIDKPLMDDITKLRPALRELQGERFIEVRWRKQTPEEIDKFMLPSLEYRAVPDNDEDNLLKKIASAGVTSSASLCYA